MGSLDFTDRESRQIMFLIWWRSVTSDYGPSGQGAEAKQKPVRHDPTPTPSITHSAVDLLSFFFHDRLLASRNIHEARQC